MTDPLEKVLQLDSLLRRQDLEDLLQDRGPGRRSRPTHRHPPGVKEPCRSVLLREMTIGLPGASIAIRHGIGRGNCTRRPLSATHCSQFGYDLSSGDAQDMCREDAALRELVANWHGLTPSVRDAIMALVRVCETQ